MAVTGRTFRVFVSSTFGDMKDERNALQEHVFPRLRELCTQHGARFQAIDLRWGVSEQAGHDQRTMNICLSEVERWRVVAGPDEEFENWCAYTPLARAKVDLKAGEHGGLKVVLRSQPDVPDLVGRYVTLVGLDKVSGCTFTKYKADSECGSLLCYAERLSAVRFTVKARPEHPLGSHIRRRIIELDRLEGRFIREPRTAARNEADLRL